MTNNHCWSTHICKLMLWRAGNWEKVEHKSSFFIRVHFDQLMITADDKVIESLNIKSKIKCVYKDDVVIIIASNALKDVRKTKFQIQSGVKEFLSKLAQYFPVTNHNTKESIAAELKYQTIDDIFKQVLYTTDVDSAALPLPPEYPSFVKKCLLDPSFPDVIRETEHIINSISKSRTVPNL